VAQVHALLFLSPQPLPADEISETLAVARSNVSTSLRELQGWRIVRVVHVLETGATISTPSKMSGKFSGLFRKSASGERLIRH